ncbi:MAG: effector-associated constant component EACC1 [Anaerolineales bacterium]
MIKNSVNFQVLISEEEAEPERIDLLTIQLRRDLLEMGVEQANRPAGKAPAKGSKGDAFTIGALALAAAPAMLPNLISFLQSWALRGENRKVKIKTPEGLEIEFTPEKKLSDEELVALVDKLTKPQS